MTKLAEKNRITQGKKHHNTITTSLEHIDTLVNEAKLQTYMQHWYELVQQANLMMQNHAPWTKLKDESTKESGIQDLEHLLWEIKQITLLSAPFLTNSFKKVQEILGNDLLSQIDSSNNLSDLTLFETLYNMEEFEINLSPDVVYQKKD